MLLVSSRRERVQSQFNQHFGLPLAARRKLRASTVACGAVILVR